FHVAIGTNGYQGGAAGYGSRTFFQIRDAGGTDMEVSLTQDGRGVTIQLGGDSELSTFADALEFAAQTLRSQGAKPRSEEHTSELQSRENLVCRLLLEKKKI